MLLGEEIRLSPREAARIPRVRSTTENCVDRNNGAGRLLPLRLVECCTGSFLIKLLSILARTIVPFVRRGNRGAAHIRNIYS